MSPLELKITILSTQNRPFNHAQICSFTTAARIHLEQHVYVCTLKSGGASTTLIVCGRITAAEGDKFGAENDENGRAASESIRSPRPAEA